MTDTKAAERIEQAISKHQTFLGRFKKQIEEDWDAWLRRSLRELADTGSPTKKVAIIVAAIEAASVLIEHLIRRLF